MDKLAQIDAILAKMRGARPAAESLPSAAMPLSIGVNHQPIDPMIFKVGEWTKTPWEGVSCLGVSLAEKRVTVVCEVLKPIRMDKQEHGPWTETLTMHEGYLYEHTTGKSYYEGGESYVQPAGVIHEPEFKTRSLCLITWTR